MTSTGPGAVDGAGLSGCRGSCSFTAPDGAAITLAAAPDAGAVFSGWSGACSGRGSCSFTASSDAQVAATFAAAPPAPAGKHNLLVSKIGSGSVRSSPTGVDCGSTCAAAFDDGTLVSLIPTPDANFRFAGWGGACSGTGACSVSLSSDVSVSATFTASPPPPDECAGLAPHTPGTPLRVQLQDVGSNCHAGHADGQGNLELSYDQLGSLFLHFFDASGKPLGKFIRHREDLQLAEQAEGYLFLDGIIDPYPEWVTGSGQIAHQSPPEGGYYRLMDDPTGGGVVSKPADPSAIAAYDAHANLRWKVQLSGGGISVAHGVDRVGNTLVITRVGDIATSRGTWFDHDGKQQPGSVAVPNYGVPIQLVPRVGSGFFLQSLTASATPPYSFAASWKGQIEPLGTVITDPPAWLSKYDHRKLHPARGGTAYAFIDQSGDSPDCTQRIEVVAATGKSCGSASFNAGVTGACATLSIDVAYDGTVIQQLSPSAETPDPTYGKVSCTWQAWSGLLR